jgi:hypothetical protein
MMRYLIIPALALAACGDAERMQRPATELSTFTADLGAVYDCTFFSDKAPDTFIFVTLKDNPEYEAQVEYGGERLKLFPKAPPDLALDSQEVLYSVEQYAGYDLRLIMNKTDIGYAGEIELRQFKTDVPEVVSTRSFTGSCDS